MKIYKVSMFVVFTWQLKHICAHTAIHAVSLDRLVTRISLAHAECPIQQPKACEQFLCQSPSTTYFPPGSTDKDRCHPAVIQPKMFAGNRTLGTDRWEQNLCPLTKRKPPRTSTVSHSVLSCCSCSRSLCCSGVPPLAVCLLSSSSLISFVLHGQHTSRMTPWSTAMKCFPYRARGMPCMRKSHMPGCALPTTWVLIVL